VQKNRHLDSTETMKKFIAMLGFLLLSGCATMGSFDAALKVQVKPFPIIRGVPFTAEINAPSDSTEVMGHAEVPLGPDMKFKKSAGKDKWTFTGTVPKAFYIHPGSFKVKVTVTKGKEKPRFTQFQMQLK
jgi:hypothetical protein